MNYAEPANPANQTFGYSQVVSPDISAPLGSTVENIGEAVNRLETEQRRLEERLIGCRPELANAAMTGGAGPTRPLATDLRSFSERLHRVADMFGKLNAQL